MQPGDADAYFGRVLPDAGPSTRTGRTATPTVFFQFLELRHKIAQPRRPGAAALSARSQASAKDPDQIRMFRVLSISRAVRAHSAAPGLGLGAGYDIPVLRIGSTGFGGPGVPHGLPGRLGGATGSDRF